MLSFVRWLVPTCCGRACAIAANASSDVMWRVTRPLATPGLTPALCPPDVLWTDWRGHGSATSYAAVRGRGMHANGYANQPDSGDVRGCPLTYAKRADLQKLDTHKHRRTRCLGLGVK